MHIITIIQPFLFIIDMVFVWRVLTLWGSKGSNQCTAAILEDGRLKPEVVFWQHCWHLRDCDVILRQLRVARGYQVGVRCHRLFPDGPQKPQIAFWIGILTHINVSFPRFRHPRSELRFIILSLCVFVQSKHLHCGHFADSINAEDWFRGRKIIKWYKLTYLVAS